MAAINTRKLPQVIVSLLSLASSKFGCEKVPLLEFDALYLELLKKFGDRLPRVWVTSRVGHNVYCRDLADAIAAATRMGVDIGMPRFQFLEVSRGNASWLLERMRANEHLGSEAIVALEPVAEMLAKAVQNLTIAS